MDGMTLGACGRRLFCDRSPPACFTNRFLSNSDVSRGEMNTVWNLLLWQQAEKCFHISERSDFISLGAACELWFPKCLQIVENQVHGRLVYTGLLQIHFTFQQDARQFDLQVHFESKTQKPRPLKVYTFALKSMICTPHFQHYLSPTFRVESKSPKTAEIAPMGGTAENWCWSPSGHHYQNLSPWGRKSYFFLPTSICTGWSCIGT